MKAGYFWAVIALLGLLSVSCKQDAIFFYIANEKALRVSRIPGSPTNMVVFKRYLDSAATEPIPIMYVASGRLYWYVNSQWDLGGKYGIPQPEGKIIALAVAEPETGGQRLYALCQDNSTDINATLRYIESSYGSTWQTISPPPADIQTIYADPKGEWLFAGAGRSITYDIYYLRNTDTRLQPLQSNTSLLSGAVYIESEKNYYLATRGSGIFQISEEADGSLKKTQSGNANFMSMIKLEGDTIIAVERDGGVLYKIKDDGSYERMGHSTDNYATTALALWEDERPKKALMVGIQGGLYSTTSSSYTYGYVEFELDPDDSTIINRHDSGNLLSADNNQYMTSLGKHPVNHLFQAPKDIDPNMTFFASTQTKGLWSYRARDRVPQWNAEE